MEGGRWVVEACWAASLRELRLNAQQDSQVEVEWARCSVKSATRKDVVNATIC